MSPEAIGRWADLSEARMHVVSGKGGTGKTTVAAALALALAAGGKKTLLLEVEGRQGLARVFDVPPLPYEERKVAVAPHGGDVIALAVDPEAALLEYLEMFYNMRRAGNALRRLGAIDFATTIAPGVRDVLLTGKAMEATKRKDSRGRHVYDAVVMDAPPTGRVVRFLNVNTEVAGLAKVGPIRTQADTVMSVIKSRVTTVHLVTLLEEMPVQETIDGIAELRAAGLPVGGVFVNMVRQPMLPPDALAAAAAGTLDPASIAQGLVEAGLAPPSGKRTKRVAAWAEALAKEAYEHAQRVALETQEREQLRRTGRPLIELPHLAGGIDVGSLYTLAACMHENGIGE
jgi:anion-transporting  ArsA/GET3 family ATPase